jgi:integrase
MSDLERVQIFPPVLSGRSAGYQPEDIQELVPERCLQLQAHLQLGNTYGAIELPRELCPPGQRSRAHRYLDIRGSLSGNVPNEAIDPLVHWLTRYALLVFSVPSSRRGHLQPNSALAVVRRVTKMVVFSAKAAADAGRPVLGDFVSVLASGRVPKNLGRDASQRWLRELDRMCYLRAQGLWKYGPAALSQLDQSDLFDPVASNAGPLTWEPLPDVFVAEAGGHACWVIDQLGEALLDCATQLIAVLAVDTTMYSVSYQRTCRTVMARQLLAKYEWLSPDGQAIDRLPFALERTPTGTSITWPPTTSDDVLSFLGLLQFSHMFVFLLSTGARVSETMSLESDCLSGTHPEVTAIGRTYKLISRVGGELREWPLCKRGEFVIRQQVDLRAVTEAWHSMARVGAVSADHANKSIWSSASSDGIMENSVNRMFTYWVRALGLEGLLSGKKIHSHRFRKTVARLIALAVVGAPKILMDLFGHKSIDMTLHYILADPRIRAEVAQVAKAQTVMLAKEVIDESADLGGPAGVRIRLAVANERARLGRDFHASDLAGMAEILTLGGKTWQIVRPGVICIKSVYEHGACTGRAGLPATDSCRSTCSHRLERAFLKEDVDAAINQAVGLYKQATEVGDEIMSEQWAGQILANLVRFPDLQAKWSKHAVVTSLEGAHYA